MLIYVFDGTFAGLLTSIYEAYYRHETPQKIIKILNMQENLLDRYVYIKTDSEKSIKVYNSIRDKITSSAQENVYYVFLSEVEDSGTWIYEYLKVGWKVGRNLDLHLADERILRVINLRRKVFGELHRMLGLLRFKCLENGLYYSRIQTDYNIVELLAPHFAERLSDQQWIIHDVKRGLAAIYDGNNWAVAKVSGDSFRNQNDSENDYQELWKHFFKNIAVPNRLNPKLQKQLMPVRYWKYLTEKQL